MWKTSRLNPKYMVSDDGQVKRSATGRILHQYIDRYGYPYVALSSKKYKVHRLVADAFIGSTDGKEVDHIDTNRQNNYVENLRIVTRKENANNPLSIANLKKHGKRYAELYGRKVMNKMGETYCSIIEAHRATGIPRSNIQYHLKNNTGEWFYV